MAKKETSCWPGYERVPGKAAGTKGSCRKKAASKSTANDKEFQHQRKKQLDEWQKTHPGSPRSAAQHLSEPGKRKTTTGKQAPKRKSR